MPIRVTCPECGERFRVEKSRAGKRIRCRGCESLIVVDVDGLGDDDERPRRRQSGHKGLWIGLIVGGVVAGVAVALLGVALMRPRTLGGPAGLVQPGGPMPPQAAVGPITIDTGPVQPAEFGPSRVIKPGVRFQEARLTRNGVPMLVWYYEPVKAAGKLPLVVVPPAGSTLFTGMELGDGDRAEHFPYASAGFAVASFEIDGYVADLQGASDATLLQAARAFRAAQGGLANAKAALDFVLAKAPNVDADRVYIAGHSSAATLALLYAEHEPRIKACASFCGVMDLESRLADAIPMLERGLPGYRRFLIEIAPKTHVERLQCPVLLFHARDDSNVPVRQTLDFAALLQKTNPRVTVSTNATGDHYNAMIRAGIPEAIQWFQRQSAKQ